MSILVQTQDSFIVLYKKNFSQSVYTAYNYTYNISTLVKDTNLFVRALETGRKESANKYYFLPT